MRVAPVARAWGELARAMDAVPARSPTSTRRRRQARRAAVDQPESVADRFIVAASAPREAHASGTLDEADAILAGVAASDVYVAAILGDAAARAAAARRGRRRARRRPAGRTAGTR